jgi:hypothetical protein
VLEGAPTGWVSCALWDTSGQDMISDQRCEDSGEIATYPMLSSSHDRLHLRSRPMLLPTALFGELTKRERRQVDAGTGSRVQITQPPLS